MKLRGLFPDVAKPINGPSVAEQRGIMTAVYVIQVMARHGVGSQGWRTVRRPSGEPYCFQTHAAALQVLREHFPALREDRDVRVHAVADEPSRSVRPTAPQPPHQLGDPCQ